MARAMLTTDKVEKTAAVTTATRPAYTVGGVAKGSGMIHPNMATMLAVIATDAPIHAGSLRTILRHAVERSFHEISVDGDVSTNDAVLLLAKHPGDGPLLSHGAETEVVRAICDVAAQLARRIVEDGEGAHRVLTIDVTGAASRADAKRVAAEIARSSLVKTALAGGDPNWGRLLSAAGAAGAAFSPETARLTIGDHLVFADGEPRSLDARALDRAFADPEVRIRLDLGRGRYSGRMLTTDLTHDYVEINSAYTT